MEICIKRRICKCSTDKQLNTLEHDVQSTVYSPNRALSKPTHSPLLLRHKRRVRFFSVLINESELPRQKLKSDFIYSPVKLGIT